MIRTAEPEDLPMLQDLERAAGEIFRGLGMDAIADDEPLSLDELAAFQRQGRAFVVGATPVAYLLLDVLDDCAHVEQVTVHPGCRGQRLGAQLLDRACAWAQKQGLSGLTLTTFQHVPWNGPYYARIGFVVLDQDQLGPGLRRAVAHEAERGLARWPRVTMRRPADLSDQEPGRIRS